MAQLLAMSFVYVLTILLVVFVSGGGALESLLTNLLVLGGVLETSFGWMLTTAFAFVALAHVAVIGGGLDREQHRNYFNAMSSSCIFVVSAIAVSALMIVVSWGDSPERFVLLVPLLPLLFVLIVVGVQVGRFNNLDGVQELESAESELKRIEVRISKLYPVGAGRAWTAIFLHVGLIVAAVTALGVLATGNFLPLMEAATVSAVLALIGFVASIPAIVSRISTDAASRVLGYFLYGALLTVTVFMTWYLTLDPAGRVFLVALIPLLAVQVSFASPLARFPLSMAGVVDVLAYRVLAADNRRLDARRAVLIEELAGVESRFVKTIRKLFRSRKAV